MSCRRVNNLLSAFMDGELPGVEQLQIRDHLRICDACSAEYESLLMTKRMVANLATKCPRSGFEEQILARIAAEKAHRHSGMTSWWGLLPEPQRASLRAAALFGVFAVAAGLYVYTPPRKQMPAAGAFAAAAIAPVEPARMPVVAPVRDYMVIHNSSEDALPMGAVPLVPAGDYSSDAAARR